MSVDPTNLSYSYINDQKSTDPTMVHQIAIENHLKDLHTGCPGIVQTFDPVKQTATVQPALQRLFTDRGWVNLPVCEDVIVQFPRGGGLVFTFPVQQGEECWLAFSERALDYFYSQGQVQKPSRYRMHSLSDAVAMLGIGSQPNIIPNFNTEAAELRTVDGTAKFSLGQDKSLLMTNPNGNFSISAEGAATLNAVSYQINCPTTFADAVTVDSTVTASGDITSGSVSLQNHKHFVTATNADTEVANT